MLTHSIDLERMVVGRLHPSPHVVVVVVVAITFVVVVPIIQ